jgi:DnaD/phage-associated family protein
MSEQQAPYITTKVLADLLDRPIAYNPAFKKIGGSAEAAIFLSQAFYWTRRLPKGRIWFYKSQHEWQDETGLTRWEQKTARKNLLERGLIDEKLAGAPAILHFRVVQENLYSWLLGTFQFVGTPHTDDATYWRHYKLVWDNATNINKESETTQRLHNDKDAAIAGNLKELSKLYQANVGLITPLIADMLKAASEEYPAEWYAPAFEIAVKNNARKWNYVEAVLKSWDANGFGWTPKKDKPNGTYRKSEPAQTPDYTDDDRALAARLKAQRAPV